MKLMRPEKCFVKLFSPLFLIILLVSTGLHAQSRKSKKPTAKKTQTSSRDAKKVSRASAKKKDSRKEKAAASKRSSRADAKKDRLTAKEKARDKNSRKKKSAKETAEERRAAAARRREEEKRRQAILAERRRREQAAREARARKLAFERGLRTATVENISHDNAEGEDLKIRQAAVNALGSHAGTIVVMEAQTGKLVTVVNQDWAIRHGFKPCSTIKLVTGVAGLSEDLIDDDGSIRNSSSRMELQDALAYSNNGYFQRVGSNMGSTKMIEYAKNLGLGEPTGINAEGETGGRLPFGNNNARIYSHGDDFEVTPLQLAVMVSAISNGGKRVVPHFTRSKIERTNFRGTVRREVNVPKNDLQGVIPGMIGAAEYGTARRGVDASMGIAGKTGSCIGKGSWVGLFASVAPIENPKYSVVVITRGQSERGKYAAAIAGKIYSALSNDIRRSTEVNPNWARVKPKQQVDERTAAGLDEEEDEEVTETAEARATDEDPIIVGAGQPRVTAPAAVPTPAPKKLVVKTVQSKPKKFPPVVITYKKDGSLTERPSGVAPGERPRIVKN